MARTLRPISIDSDNLPNELEQAKDRVKYALTETELYAKNLVTTVPSCLAVADVLVDFGVNLLVRDNGD